MIYLDNAATTKPDDVFLEAYIYASKNLFFNSSAIYKNGVDNQVIIDSVKSQISKMLGLGDKPENFVFTNSATSANNLAIQGSYKSNWKHVLISKSEHPSVYNIIPWLENRGVKVDEIPLMGNGQIDYDEFEILCDVKTNFISIMAVCNETGAKNDLERICKIKQKKSPNAIVHCDGVQGFGKIEINLQNSPIDLFSLSAHKIGGAKGLGVLYSKNIKSLKPILYGGGQEKGLNSGTQDVCSIYAFGKLLETINIKKNFDYVSMLKKIFLSCLGSQVNFNCNSDEKCSPYILSLSFPNLNGETMVHALEEKGVLISTGSACSSRKKGNRILQSMGIDQKQIVSSVRISFSIHNTIAEIEESANIIAQTYKDLIKRVAN